MNRWLPPLAWLGVVLWLTLSPRPIPADLEPPGRLDLAGHFAVFAVLAFLTARAARDPRGGNESGGRRWMVTAVLVAFAAADELLQPPVAGRDAAWSDFLANLAGIGLGLVTARRGAAAAGTERSGAATGGPERSGAAAAGTEPPSGPAAAGRERPSGTHRPRGVDADDA